MPLLHPCLRRLLAAGAFAALGVASSATKHVIGLTAQQQPIEAWLAANSDGSRPRLLLIGGLDGDSRTAQAVKDQLTLYEQRPQVQKRLSLAAIPLANPDRAPLAFPPSGDAYRDNPESHVLWRWTGVFAPDLVVIVGPDPGNLAAALNSAAAAGVGRIPARRESLQAGWIEHLNLRIGRSEARVEIERRLKRSPRELAEQMAQIYGHEFPDAVYIPAVALIGRLRLGHQAEVERIVAPFRDGLKHSLAKPTASHLSGHLIFAELAERTGDARYRELVRAAADLGFTPDGQMKESMPLHNRMSDSVFMACPILAKAGKLTGENRYFDMALRHYRFMRALDLRADGLWRHSPLDEAAWGRGNAFAALGLALTLTDMPKSHPGFVEMRRDFEQLAAALARHQDASGLWRQVIDLPGAYPELSATCMIAVALLRGIGSGWLDKAGYEPLLERAWRAVKTRVSASGELIDVCESTGSQKSLTDYLRRKAILGRDARGGAMVLLLATEMARLGRRR